MNSISKKYTRLIICVILTIVIGRFAYVGVSAIINRSIRPSSDSDTLTERFPCPCIQNPDFTDSYAWSKIFNVRFKETGTPVYGVNIWQVKEKNLVASITNIVDQGAIGLVQEFGQIHAIKTYPVENSDLYTVVFIYDWRKNPWDLVASQYTKLALTWKVFHFFNMVEAFNWVGTTNLESDLSVYAGLLDKNLHADLCDDKL